MLTIHVSATELFDEDKNEFVPSVETTLELEHSLASLSSWESKWEQPFLGPKEKTTEQTLDYIRCMTLTPEIPPEVFSSLSDENLDEINRYINTKMTATTFNEMPDKTRSRELVTAELIYYWMIAMDIPFECERWHLNKLLTLIKVVNIKNQPAKKQGPIDMAARRRLNEERQAKYNTTG